MAARLSYRAVAFTGIQKLISTMLNYDPKPPIYDTTDYLNVYNLVGHKPKVEEHFYFAFVAYYLAQSLKYSGTFFPFSSKCRFHYTDSKSLLRWKEDNEVCSECVQLVGGVLLRQMKSFASNAFSINKYCGAGNPALEIAEGIYPTTSLANHSCDPNVIGIHYNINSMIIRTMRPIKKDDEIHYCYVTYFALEPKETRQKALFDDYSFLCKCSACDGDWALLYQLPIDPVLKCVGCGKTTVENNKLYCKCGQKTDFKKQRQEIGTSNLNYYNALQNLHVKGKTETAINAIHEHLKLLDRNVCRPDRGTLHAQGSLVSYYQSLANS